MKKSFAAAMLVLSLALGAAAPAAVRAEEIGPGIGLEEKIAAQQAAAQAGVTAAAEETTAAQTAETAGAAENTASAADTAAAAGTTGSLHRKTAEEMQAAMAATPA